MENFTYKNEDIKVVNSYTYLGVPVTSSGLGLSPAKDASRKARVAISTVMSICSKCQADSWWGTKKLYDCIFSATLLYAAPIWGLRYADALDKVHFEFIKRIYGLQRTTASYTIRLEFNLVKVIYKVVEHTLNYIIKILDMKDCRYPKICFFRQVHLF